MAIFHRHLFSPLKVGEVSLTKPDTLRHIEPGTTPGTQLAQPPEHFFGTSEVHALP